MLIPAIKKLIKKVNGSSSGRSQTLQPKMPPKRGLTKKELHMVECKKRARKHLGIAA